MLSSFNPTQTAAVFVAFLIAFPVESDGGGEAAINQGRCFGGPSLSVPPTARPGRAGSSSRGPKPRPIAGSRRGRSPLPRSYPLGQGGRGRGPPERDGPQQGRSLPPPSPATPPAPRFPDPGIHVSGTRTGLRRRRDGRSGAAQQLPSGSRRPARRSAGSPRATPLPTRARAATVRGPGRAPHLSSAITMASNMSCLPAIATGAPCSRRREALAATHHFRGRRAHFRGRPRGAGWVGTARERAQKGSGRTRGGRAGRAWTRLSPMSPSPSSLLRIGSVRSRRKRPLGRTWGKPDTSALFFKKMSRWDRVGQCGSERHPRSCHRTDSPGCPGRRLGSRAKLARATARAPARGDGCCGAQKRMS